jgi:hypothetical protein
MFLSAAEVNTGEDSERNGSKRCQRGSSSIIFVEMTRQDDRTWVPNEDEQTSCSSLTDTAEYPQISWRRETISVTLDARALSALRGF